MVARLLEPVSAPVLQSSVSAIPPVRNLVNKRECSQCYISPSSADRPNPPFPWRFVFSILNVPFPTCRLSSIAMKALAVDKELSPLVQRRFSTVTAASITNSSSSGSGSGSISTSTGTSTSISKGLDGGDDDCVLRVHYSATTNRMLRVAVNSFMDSLALILEVMEKLDVDVLEAQHAG